jgi:hypothetical protein
VDVELGQLVYLVQTLIERLNLRQTRSDCVSCVVVRGRRVFVDVVFLQQKLLHCRCIFLYQFLSDETADKAIFKRLVRAQLGSAALNLRDGGFDVVVELSRH